MGGSTIDRIQHAKPSFYATWRLLLSLISVSHELLASLF
jgi:hypothetical protein